MPAPHFPTFTDGYYATPIRISRTPREYPFSQNGDITTAVYMATYVVNQGQFTPTARGTVDPETAGFYLLAESKPEIVQGDLATFTRTYSNIPLQQIVPGSMYVTKPSLSGSFPRIIGGSLVIQPDPSVATFKFYSQFTVNSDSGPPAVVNYPTGGTYTLTLGASTTSALAYNASAGTVQTALNALASLTDRSISVTVSGAYNTPTGFQLSTTPYAVGSINVSGLTGTTVIAPNASVAGGTLIGGLFYTRFMFTALGWPASGDQITGGTFTITMFGQTTAPIAYNASLATATAAIQALSKVGVTAVVSSHFSYGSGIIGGTGGGKLIVLFVDLPNYAFTANAASLTPSGSIANTDGFGNVTFGGVAATVRILNAPSHGLTEADNILITQGGVATELLSGKFTVVDANTIQLSSASGAPFFNASAITAIGKLTSTYSGGTVLTRIKRVMDFYLPGVSPGITTIDDVPLPVYQGDADSLLAAIMAGSTSINYEVGDLLQWRDSPILTRTRITLNAATL
jgi:hypothetical protein